MKKIFLAYLLAFSVFSSTGFAKVTLRDEAVIDGKNIMLSDIFDGIRPDENHKIASAPKPMESIVLDAGFLSQVANGYGIDYKIKTGYEKIKVFRSGKPVTDDEISLLLRDALKDKNVGDDYDITYINRESIAVPLNSNNDFSISELAYSDKTGMLVAVLKIRDADGIDTDYKINARVNEMTEIPVMKTAVAIGHEIKEDDIAYERVRSDRVRANIALSADELIGRYAKRTLKTGQMVSINDLKIPSLVTKGKQVRVLFKRPYMTLTIIGKALESGTKDETIRVMNPNSKAIIHAVVADVNTVIVSEI